MSTTEVLMRHTAIINRLVKSPATLKEIEESLALQSELHGYNLRVSKRTFLRDVEDILSLFKIHIAYDFSKKKYAIHANEDEGLNNRILEAFDTLNALNSSVGYSRYLDLEKRKSRGNNNIYGLLHAIKNRLQIEIRYQSYWDVNASLRKVEPYLLKEFKNRWYLIAKDLAKNELRTYALDRILELNFSKKKFSYPKDFIPETHFKDSFGIIKSEEDNPIQEVLLSFNPHQGKYLKSLPLHASQEIIKDDENELLLKLNIYITFDFIMELLSYGENVEVLEPAFLRDAMRERLQLALGLYEG